MTIEQVLEDVIVPCELKCGAAGIVQEVFSCCRNNFSVILQTVQLENIIKHISMKIKSK